METENVIEIKRMHDTKAFTLRLSTSLIQRIDTYSKKLGLQMPGLRVSRTAAIRMLLTKALSEVSNDKH